MLARREAGMSRLTPLETSFFAMESPTRPMHAGGVMLFDAPEHGDVDTFVDDVFARFRATPAVPPWNRRPVIRLPLPHWEAVENVELDYHVRRATLPRPGSIQQLMELVSHLYPTLLDRDRPLWEAYIIDGIEHARTAVFVKAHHSLADGVGGLKMFFGSLSNSPDDDPRPVWAGPRENSPRRSTSEESGWASRIARVAQMPRALAQSVPDTVRLALDGPAPPFMAAKTPTTGTHISAARSFAALELPLSDVKRVGKAHGATVNDVLLSLCDDAMHRYVSEEQGVDAGRMVAIMPLSTRKEGDEATHAAGAVLVSLGAPSATPQERIKQVVASTHHVKARVRRASPLAFQLQTFAVLAAMELREQLPVGRSLVPNVANFTLSNVSGSPSGALYLGRAQMAALYAVPIVTGSNAANITVIPYRESLCIGIGAARNLIPNTPRLAELIQASFAGLRERLPTKVASR